MKTSKKYVLISVCESHIRKKTKKQQRLWRGFNRDSFKRSITPDLGKLCVWNIGKQVMFIRNNFLFNPLEYFKVDYVQDQLNASGVMTFWSVSVVKAFGAFWHEPLALKRYTPGTACLISNLQSIYRKYGSKFNFFDFVRPCT